MIKHLATLYNFAAVEKNGKPRFLLLVKLQFKRALTNTHTHTHTNTNVDNDIYEYVGLFALYYAYAYVHKYSTEYVKFNIIFSSLAAVTEIMNCNQHTNYYPQNGVRNGN